MFYTVVPFCAYLCSSSSSFHVQASVLIRPSLHHHKLCLDALDRIQSMLPLIADPTPPPPLPIRPGINAA